MTTKKVEKKEMSLVQRIVKALNLGDEGKIGKFFNMLEKQAKTEIKKLEANRKTADLQHEIAVGDLKAKVEDAEEAVEAAYENVTPEDVPNNDAMKSFARIYWTRVENAERNLKMLKKELEEEKEDYKELLEDIDEQIANYKARINRIK